MSDLWLPETAGVVPVQAQIEDVSPDDRLSVGVFGVHAIADSRVIVDADNFKAVADGKRLSLFPKHLQVLAVLASQPDQLVTHAELSERVWGDPDRHFKSASPVVTLYELRYRLGRELGDPQTGALRTRRRLGYMAVSSLNGKSTTPNNESSTYRFADDRIEVNPQDLTAVCDGRVIAMPLRPFCVLEELAQRPGWIVPTAALVRNVWGEFNNDNLANMQTVIGVLRKTLGGEFSHPVTGAIRNSRGIGYLAVRSLRESIRHSLIRSA